MLSATADTDEHGVTPWLHQDAHDAHDVGHGVREEDEVHLAGRRQVVVQELLVEAHEELLTIIDQLVILRLGLERQDVGEDDVLVLAEGLLWLGPLDLELHRQELARDVMERFNVLFGAQPVSEDSRALVQPQLSVVVAVGYLEGLAHEEALEDLRDVTQVERVVELGRDGQHCAAHLQVHIDRSLHGDARLELVASLLISEETAQDLLKDQCQRFFGRFRDVHDLEVSHEARGERLPAATRRCCSANNREFLNVLPLASLAIIVALLVNELPEKLNRWLGSIELFLRHVDVIDENEALCVALDRAKDILPLLLQLGIDVLLCADAFRLC